VAGGLAAVKIDPQRAWRITCDYLLAFFAKHLIGADAPLLDASTPPYPEARLRVPKDLLAVDPHQAQQTWSPRDAKPAPSWKRSAHGARR
jgi:hypothetical protein